MTFISLDTQNIGVKSDKTDCGPCIFLFNFGLCIYTWNEATFCFDLGCANKTGDWRSLAVLTEWVLASKVLLFFIYCPLFDPKAWEGIWTQNPSQTYMNTKPNSLYSIPEKWILNTSLNFYLPKTWQQVYAQ